MAQGENKADAQYERMTKTPVSRLVTSLAIPAVLSMLITNFYNLVDTAFVGQLGTSASGAVGVVFGFMAIIQAFGFMFGQGSGSIITRALGARDAQHASVHATLGFTASMLFGAIIGVAGLIAIDPLVMMLGSTPTIAPYAKTYITYILFGAPFVCSSFTLNNILRYEGRAVLGTVGVSVGALLNILGDYVFMFMMGMGIDGAGLSTALSSTVSWAILLAMFLKGHTDAKLDVRLLALAKPAMLLDIMATGLPSLFRQALNSISTVLLNVQCAPYGDAAVAGMSIVSRVIFFAFSIALGIGQGFQPVAGFNYGAHEYERVEKGYRFTIFAAEAVSLVACVLLALFPEQIIALFRNDPEVIAAGTRALRLQAYSLLALPACMATEMLLQSTGKRMGALVLSSLRNGLLFIPLLFVLAYFRGFAGIQEAQPLAIVLSLPISLPFATIYFRNLSAEEWEE